MPQGRMRARLVLTGEDRETLERWERRPTTARALAQTHAARAELRGGVAREVGVNRLTVGRWRPRFVAKRLNGPLDEPRPGAPSKIMDADAERVERALRHS